MGITGLLPLLKPVTKDVHIRELKGLTVGVDTYCWLHKGIYSCSAELCQGIATDKFIKYCVERVHLLLSHGVKPYLVFDGGHLPAKAGKEEERRARRESNLQRGMQLMREGNPSGAHQFFCKAADVTPFMAHQVIKRIPGVRYVVAPYEADAQLGFLARNGHVDAVITEDSDIMLFGCTRVVFKLDRDGTGQEVDLREVFSRRNDELDMRGMNEDDLMTLCALSGCDYLPSVHGMGLKKAYRMVSRHKEASAIAANPAIIWLPKILRAVKFDSAGSFPRGYEADFQRALLTFRHQRAFDPVSRSVVHMTPLPEILPSAITTAPSAANDGMGPRDLDRAAALAFLGPPVEQERGCAVADGDVDPITGETFSEMGGRGGGKDGAKTPESAMSEAAAAALAAWRGGSVPAPGGGGGAGKTKKLSAQGNNLTKYWGAPLPSKKSGAKRFGGGVAAGRGGFELGGAGGDGGATPDRPPRVAGFRGGGAAASRTLEKKLDPDRASPAQSPACVSPGSFYAGVSPSPPPPPATASSGEVNGCEDKENQDPLSMPPPLEDNPSGGQGEEDDPPAASTSKFFGGGGGGGGGRGDAAVQSSSGLRRRFRPPLAAGRSSAAGAAAGGRSALCGGVGGGHNDTGDTGPWGAAHYAYPRLDVPQETAAVAGATGLGSGTATCSGGGGGGGGRLKRRRTLGLGSVAPSGMIRGLEGVGGGGSGGPGRRSKSLGGRCT
ncbi:exonuclease [Ectocarpus siliculosus]|uniref:Exonuclease n=1 Tax=Ectocarpus siliculosus TaxID=2880 RepID=D7FQK7_ECTSI|nr:exonuclease [Ectocarpus siliculosus]|eukprot:CBJ30602.1 exonuclease [Ectocarpus siliculosus]